MPTRPVPNPNSPITQATPVSGGVARAAQQAAALMGQTAPGTPTDRTGQVWMGGMYDHEHSVQSELAGEGRHYEQERWLTEDQAKQYIALMSPEEYGRLFQMARALTGSDHPSASAVTSMWEDAVARAKTIRESTGRKVSPFDVMSGLAQATAAARGASGGPSSSSSSSTSSATEDSTDIQNVDTKDKSVDLISRSDAAALAEGAFKEALGRKATDTEITAMRSYINAQEKKNATVTREKGQTRRDTHSTRTESSQSQSQSDGQGNTVSSSASGAQSTSESNTTGGTTRTTSGGVNEQQAASDYAEQAGAPGEYEAYQKASKYLAALNRAILSPV